MTLKEKIEALIKKEMAVKAETGSEAAEIKMALPERANYVLCKIFVLMKLGFVERQAADILGASILALHPLDGEVKSQISPDEVQKLIEVTDSALNNRIDYRVDYLNSVEA